MTDDMKISVEQITGSVEIKTWFEADMLPSGDWQLRGKSCAIHRRRDGSIWDVKFSDTGILVTIPMGFESSKSRGLFARFVDRMRSNA